MKYRTFLLAGFAAVTASYAAETNTVESAENEVIVSATRIDTPIEQIGSSVSVISAEDIARQNSKNVQSAIKLTPGVQMTQSGSPGTASSVYIRGANANHTLVLINGIRVNSNTTGTSNLTTIPTDSIDRIEVLRGSQSALYGSDAIGGVVNVVTKKGAEEGLGGSLLLEMGTKGYLNTMGTLSGGNKIFDFNASASHLGLEEYDIASENGGREDDPFWRRAYFADLGLNFASDGRADLVLMYNDMETDLDGFKGSDVPNKSTVTEFWLTSLDITKPFGDIYEQGLTFGYNEEQNTGIQNGSSVSYLETRNFDFNAQADLYVHDSDTVNIGYDFRRTEGENDRAIEPVHRTQNSVFLNNQWRWQEALFVTVGGRYDDYSDIDGKATWNATASWFVLEQSRLHGSAGTGYKAPTFNDLYYSAFGWVGNPDLKPEESRSFDIGFEQSLFAEKVVADVTYFHNEIKNLINWDWILQTPMNVSEARTRGIETSLSYTPVESLTTRLHYTYTDTEDIETGNWLARRARHTGGFAVNWNYTDKGSIYSDLVYIGKRYDDAANNSEMDDYGLINLGTQYAVTDNWSILANVNNLMDKYYETAAGYGSVGRVVSLGIQAQF